MSTVYDYDLHDLAESTFSSIQQRALVEQSLRDATPTQVDATPVAPTAPVAPAAPAAPATPATQRKKRPEGATRGGLMHGGLVKKLAIGAAVVGAVGGIFYFGSRLTSTRKKD